MILICVFFNPSQAVLFVCLFFTSLENKLSGKIVTRPMERPHRGPVRLHSMAALNPWVLTSLGGLNIPFIEATYQIPCISDIYSMSHNSTKIAVINENNFIVGGHHNPRNCIKATQH